MKANQRNQVTANGTTHPLPRGGTDFIPKLHQYLDISTAIGLAAFAA